MTERAWAPSVGVVAAALVLGVWSAGGTLADPVHLVPDTRFTEPQLLATALVRANLALGDAFAGTTPLLGWPDTADFRPVVWPMLILGWVVAPTVAFNTFWVLAPALNAAGGALFGAALGLDRWARAGLAMVLATHPWVRETLANGQLEQALLGGVAGVWALGVWAGRGSRAALSALFPAFLVLTFTGPHLGIAAGVGLALLAAGDLVARRGAGWGGWGAALLAGAAGAGAAGAWYAGNFSAKVQVFWPKGSPGRASSLASLPESASLSGLLLPPAPPDLDTQTLHPLYLGAVLIAAAAWSRRRAPGVLWLPLVGTLLLAFGAWIGPVPGPYQLLSALSPAIAQSQSPYRMLAAVVVLLAALAAPAVRRGGHLVVFGALTLTESLLVTTRPFVAPVRAWALDPLPAALTETVGPVLDLPLLGPRCPDAANHYAVEAARRRRPVPVLPAAAAFYPTVPQLARRVIEATQARPCGPALRDLVDDLGFTSVVLHTHDPGCTLQPSFVRCLEEGLGPGTEADGIRVWEVGATRGE